MAYKVGGTEVAIDGNPYLWGSADTTTVPSNETKITASDATSNEYFGRSVAVGNGKIVVGNDPSFGNISGVYIYDLDGTNETKITASDAAADDKFGSSVAVGCGKIVVGAYGNTSNTGSVYIYNLDGTNETKITASDGATGDEYGESVAIGNGKIVVGARYDDDNGADSGSVYIYDLDGTNETKITASDGASNDRFGGTGGSVAVNNGRIVVGAPGDDSNTGSAYIYDLNGNELSKITASDAAGGDNFGYSVAVGSGRIVVGAPFDDDDGSTSGSVYIYNLDGTNETKITASDAAAGDFFGGSVAVGSGRIVVGAYLDDSAYIFDLNGNQLAKITASDAAAGDSFGRSVGVNNDKIVVGAQGNDDNGSASGSAYIYTTPRVYTVWDAIDLEYG